jgi:hypothetical protein
MAAEEFDWFQYFRLAEELAKRTDDSALRSALSRAYYYVFHLGLQRAQKNGFTFSDSEGTHKQLWRIFKLSPEPDCQKLGEIAGRLKEKRRRADYESNYARLADEIPLMMADAQDFAARLQRLNPRHPNPASVRQ